MSLEEVRAFITESSLFRYLDVDGWQYWVCESLENEPKVTLINRACSNRLDRHHNFTQSGA